MKSVNHTEVIRRSKGLTQKGLADLANVELRVVKQIVPKSCPNQDNGLAMLG